MRLLFVSYRFPPVISSEALLMPRTLWALDELGLGVTVITVNTDDCAGAVDHKLLDLVPSSIEIFTARGFERKLRSFGGVPYKLVQLAGINYYSDLWYFSAVKLAKSLLQKKQFDCIYSRASVWTSNVVGLKMKRLTGLPWIAHFSDPWVGNPYLFPNYNWMQRKISLSLERAIMEEADGVVFTNSQTVDYVMKKYPIRLLDKVHVIPHGYDPRVTENIDRPAREGSRLQIIHAGKLFAPRSPIPLFKALQILNKDNRLAKSLELVLIGSVEKEYISAAEEMGLGDVVIFLGEKPFDETAARIAQADVLLLIEADQANIPPIFLPSKLIDYLPFRKSSWGLFLQVVHRQSC